MVEQRRMFRGLRSFLYDRQDRSLDRQNLGGTGKIRVTGFKITEFCLSSEKKSNVFSFLIERDFDI